MAHFHADDTHSCVLMGNEIDCIRGQTLSKQSKLTTFLTEIMKNSIRSAVLVALATLSAASSALAGDADFTLVNRTGYDLREVYISPSNKEAWGKDRLGRNLLETGKSRLFKFSDKSSCKQDLKVVFDDDGSDVIWEDFDLCELNKITLKYNRKSGEVSADTE